LLGKSLVGGVGLGYDQQARRILVDPVDDAGSCNAPDARKRPLAMMEQGIDERPIEISCGRMNDEASGLVHDEEMFVLEQNLQRDVLRLVVCRPRFGNSDPKGFLAAYLDGRVPDGPSFRFHRAAPDQGFQPFTR
jgi:hypothetical protein